VACPLGSLLRGACNARPAQSACSVPPACLPCPARLPRLQLQCTGDGKPGWRQELVDLHPSAVPPWQPSRCGWLLVLYQMPAGILLSFAATSRTAPQSRLPTFLTGAALQRPDLRCPALKPWPRPWPVLPAGYGILRYKGAKPNVPLTPPPAPGSVAPWGLEAQAKIVMNAKMLAIRNEGAAGGVYR
jgi:hypothetical protein